MKDFAKTKEYRELRAALLASLEKRNLLNTTYRDKVNEYMDFWVRRQQLRADVEGRGLLVTDERGRVSENRSISLEIQVSRQMLALFTAMGFKPEDLETEEPDDDL